MDTLNLEKINQSYADFRSAAGLDDYDRLIVLMNALADSGQACEGGQYESLFLLLADILEQQDRQNFPLPKATPVRILRFLMEQHSLTSAQLPEVGSQGVVEQVLSGQRQLNVHQIASLCHRFGVAADLFMPSPNDGAMH